TYASGKWMERFYNHRLQTVSNVYSSVNTPTVSVSPDEWGAITRAEDSGGLVYDYDIHPIHQLLTNEVVTSAWMNWNLGHAHDRYDRETGLALSVEGVAKCRSGWSYDGNGRFDRLVCTNSSGRAIQVAYTNEGSFICGYRVQMPSGECLEQHWERVLYKQELIRKLSVSYAGRTLLERSFDYNAIHKLTRWSDAGTTNEGVYAYSRRNEVVQADVSGHRFGYGFDSAGNCIGFAMGGTTNYFRVNQLNQCTELVFPEVNGAALHAYDLDGNLVRIPGMADYEWDDENRLVAATVRQNAVTNRYDYQNRLVKQHLPGKTRMAVFDRWNLIFERFQSDDGQIEEVEYFWGPDRSGTLDGACGVGGLVAVSIGGLFYFPFYGSNAEILGYVDESGQMVASYAYGPFGESAVAAGPMADRFSFRFMTKRWDSSLGLYDFGERWYSVALRRWINRDPLGEDGGVNLYAFCDNDPVNTIDPNGCIPLDTIWDLANVVYDICVGDEVALAADTAALFVPYVPAGASKFVKAARLSKVEKICPGVKKLEVTYEYLPARFYQDGRHTLSKSALSNPKWWKQTKNGSSKFLPGWGDAEIKGLIDEAFAAAKRQGKIKPCDLDGFIYDAGRLVGASKGNKTTRIKIHVNHDGRNLHAFPVP
ncbi:MAG: RHS repeat domain-containing protein, partial [Kiritimatiellia bacterium]